MASTVKSDTSKRLGALLLQGWAMLAENCPDCKVPLMKERASEERLCVNCDTTFMPEGHGLRQTNKPPQHSTATIAALQQLQVAHPQQHQQLKSKTLTERVVEGNDGAKDDDSATLDVYDPRADPRLGPFASAAAEQQQQQADAGFLDGADDECDHRADLPAVPSNSGGGGASAASAAVSSSARLVAWPTPERRVVGQGGSFTEAAEGSQGEGRQAGGGRDARQAAGAPPLTGAPEPTAAPCGASGRRREDALGDVADMLAGKMLQGWALLDKYCPRCSTVLVRSKATKRMFCVACDAWVLTEADQQQQQAQQQPSQSKSQPAAEQQQQTHQAAPRQKGGPQQQQPATALHQPQATRSVSVAEVAVAGRMAPTPALAAETPLPTMPPGPSSAAADLVATAGGEAGVPGFPHSQLLQPLQQQQPLLQPQLQLPLSYQQFFMPVSPEGEVAAGLPGYGTVLNLSRGSSLPQQGPGGAPALSAQETPPDALRAPSAHQQPPQPQPQSQPLQSLQGRQGSCPGHGRLAPGGSGAGTSSGGGSSGGSKQPHGTALLLSIGRTVALKISEAQDLLERTPAVDTERVRSLVGLIGECLDLLAKLHSLQT